VHDSGPAPDNTGNAGVSNGGSTEADGSTITTAFGPSVSGTPTGAGMIVHDSGPSVSGIPTGGGLIVHDSGPAPDNSQNEPFSGNNYAFNFTPPASSSHPATAGNWANDGFVFKPNLAAPLTVHDFEPGDGAGTDFGHAMFGSSVQTVPPLQPSLPGIDGSAPESSGLVAFGNAASSHLQVHDFHLV